MSRRVKLGIIAIIAVCVSLFMELSSVLLKSNKSQDL